MAVTSGAGPQRAGSFQPCSLPFVLGLHATSLGSAGCPHRSFTSPIFTTTASSAGFMCSPSPPASLPLQSQAPALLSGRNNRTLRNRVCYKLLEVMLLCGLGFFLPHFPPPSAGIAKVAQPRPGKQSLR